MMRRLPFLHNPSGMRVLMAHGLRPDAVDCVAHRIRAVTPTNANKSTE
jgi:hypothetical protein